MTASISPSYTETPPSLIELSRRATIDKYDMLKYNIKTLVSAVAKLYEQGDFEYRIERYDDAFVHYMKGCSIMIEVIAKHPSFKEVKKDPVYMLLKSKTNEKILERLEAIRKKLQRIENCPIQVEGGSCDLKDVINDIPTRGTLETASVATLSSLENLPSVPSHLPIKKTLSVLNHQLPSTSTTPISPIQKTLPEHQLTSASALRIPPFTNFNFPNDVVVHPLQLADWIVKKRDRQQPNILLIDVRPRELYDQGCIKHSWTTQIEPLILKQNISSDKIEERMYANPDAEQQLFLKRDKFDLVVYYDQNSQEIANTPLIFLHEAIFVLEFRKKLSRAPMMLLGGFDAWKSVIGNKGIFCYVDSNKDYSALRKEQEMELASVKVHHTFYDYFLNVSSVDKQSMSKHTVRGKDVPPLQGVFSNTLRQSISSHESTPHTMPMPGPFTTAININSPTKQNPAIQTNTSTSITRKKTFIDNPFHGFTSTLNQDFETPPLPAKSSIDRSLPTSPKTTITNADRTTPVSSNAVSQMENIMIGTTGLKNLGNTCYMNSILQCLSGTIPFARYFLSGVFRQHINKDNFLGTGGVVAENFAEILKSMWSGSSSFISPVMFRQAIIEFAPQFRGDEQHDSQEFLTFILDGIHEDCNVAKKRPPPLPESPEEEARFERLADWQASLISWERYLERNSSVVVSLFQGQYRSRLTCLTCHATSTTYNTFMSLSLPIPAKRDGPPRVTIYDCLENFVKEEILDQDNAWKCPNCKTPRRANKALTLSKLPDVLLIHLKRFSYDGPFKNKLETVVETPLTGLDLSDYVPKTMFPPGQQPDKTVFGYDLYAVSNHFGSLSGGHYTACVRNGYKNEWHTFDDTRFSICQESKVITRAAYNLFYVRNTIK